MIMKESASSLFVPLSRNSCSNNNSNSDGNCKRWQEIVVGSISRTNVIAAIFVVLHL